MYGPSKNVGKVGIALKKQAVQVSDAAIGLGVVKAVGDSTTSSARENQFGRLREDVILGYRASI